MQCKDIPTKPILNFVSKHGGIGCNWYRIDEFDNPRSVRWVMPLDIPDNLILAKMRMLIKKGLIGGCNCGCRGDFELTKKGKKVMDEELK